MTRAEAKQILQAYRSNGSDAADAEFAAALTLVAQDAVLREWFERQQAFDRAVSAKLASVAPPPDLRAAILAGNRPSRPATLAWWRQPALMAMAAGVVLLLSASLLFLPKRAEANAALLAFVAEDARHSETHGGSGEANAALQAELGGDDMHLASLAVDFDALRSTGCRDLSFAGHDVLEVCFKRNGKWFHCYIVRSAEFPSLAEVAKPAFQAIDNEEICRWSDSRHTYLVVGDAGADAIRKLL